MKKVLSLLVILIGCLAINVKAVNVDLPTKTDHEVVKIYLFYSTTCGHCHDFLEYFQKNYIEEYKDYFEIIALEVSDSVNNSVMVSAREELGVNETGVPFIVIGDYTQVGFGSDGKAIIEEALKQYQTESYEDKVAKIIENTNEEIQEEVNELNLEEALNSIGLSAPDYDGNNSDGLYIAIIFLVVVVGLGGLVFLSRK